MSQNKLIEPVIKWSGSKRSIAPLLARLLPNAARYFEPFVGSGAMLPFRPCETAIAGDVIPELIALWQAIRNAPELTADEYAERWRRLQREGHTAYYAIRDSFNATRDPHDFLFLTRTCVNGLIRFNSDGAFNNSLHHTRPGIAPERLRQTIRAWSAHIQGVEFIAADYRATLATARAADLVFLDPPYGGTRGRYAPNTFDVETFYGELERLNCIGAKWVLTFDGNAGERSYATTLPSALYQERLGLPTGNSPFTKLMKTGIDAVVESVYLNFKPATKIANQVLDHGQHPARRRVRADVQQARLFG
jgi:DNA adenine methylase